MLKVITNKCFQKTWKSSKDSWRHFDVTWRRKKFGRHSWAQPMSDSIKDLQICNFWINFAKKFLL